MNAMPRTDFDGATFSPLLDGARLTSQLERVRKVMLDGNWYTLHELVLICGGDTASISARVRDLRKPKFGGLDVVRVRADKGLWLYRVKVKEMKQEGFKWD